MSTEVPLLNLTQGKHGMDSLLLKETHKTIIWVLHRPAGPEEAQFKVTSNTTIYP